MNLMKLDSSAFIADGGLLDAFRAKAVPVDCEHARVLFRQGEESNGLFVLHAGAVKMTIEGRGGEQVVTMEARPGSLLGLPGMVGNAPYSMSAKAEAGAVVTFVSRDDFSKLMLTEPPLGMMILRVLAAEVRTARMAIAGKI
jgi:CRP-like cAMP-binding protein